MPQILSRVGASGNYLFGDDVLTQMPELGALVARVIAGWAVTEAELGYLFAELVGAKQPATMTMYSALQSFEIQRSLLERIASERLSKRTNQLFSATLIVVGRSAITRHRFAHWIWGRSTDPKWSTKALLLAEPRHFWRLRVQKIIAARKAKGFAKIVRFRTPQGVEPENIYVYQKDDLERESKGMERAAQLAHMLCRIAIAKGDERLTLCNWLKNQSEIQSQLLRMTQAAKSNPGSSSKQPRKSHAR